MYCAKCGASNDDRSQFCEKCGAALAGGAEYAGFRRRLLASFIDGVLMAIPLLPLYILFFMDPEIGYVIVLYPLVFILPWLYNAIMESSSYQATLGKMALGIVVTDSGGKRISFARATGRHFGKIVSGLILYIGYIMIAFTQRKQGLHDIMAECLVVLKK
jgi:uncharacterized RDD family membrane protein YckC